MSKLILTSEQRNFRNFVHMERAGGSRGRVKNEKIVYAVFEEPFGSLIYELRIKLEYLIFHDST